MSILITILNNLFKKLDLLYCSIKDHPDERGRLQKGKIIAISVNNLTVGWIDVDKRHMIKTIDRTEVMLVQQPLVRRIRGQCTCNPFFLALFTFFFSLFLFVHVFTFSFTQV